MRVARWVPFAGTILVTAALVVGCGSSMSKSTSPAPVPTTRTYNGTASVGDFLNITVDGANHTLRYFNRSNGDSGTATYTVNGDGTYTLADPNGNLVTAYEVPNFVLLVQAAKTGPLHDTPSLVTAVQSAPISIAALQDHRYNYMQFRTAAGGVEIGSVVVDGAGQATNSRYWPYGAQNTSNVFHTGLVTTNSFIADSSGTFMRLPDGVGQYDYLFGTPNGVFAVDTPNGAILGFRQAASKDFASANAGTYHAIFYRKTNATTGMGNVESGTASLDQGTVTVSGAGAITIADGGGTLASGTLLPVEDAAFLYGTPTQLADPCHGLFVLRIADASHQQDVFCTFMEGAVLFSSYETALPMNGGSPYDYFYGAGLK